MEKKLLEKNVDNIEEIEKGNIHKKENDTKIEIQNNTNIDKKENAKQTNEKNYNTSNNNNTINQSKNFWQKTKSVLAKTRTKIINTRIFPILIGFIILLKTIFLYKNGMYSNQSIGREMLITMSYMAGAFIAIFIIIPMLLKPRARFWATLLVDLLVSILLCINEIYYNYSSNLVSVSQISNLQYGKEISASLPDLIHIRQIAYFIDIILIIILVIAKKIRVNKNAKFSFIPGIIYTAVIVVISSNTIPKWIENASVHQYNKIMQIEASSIYGYHFIDIRNNFNMKKNVKYKTKTAVLEAYDDLKNKYNSKYTIPPEFIDIAKDKNVIILQLESVQNFVVNKKINGYEITPNLNNFLNENITFTNMHNQSYSSTADSEYGVMNSLYPLENGRSFAQYPSNNYNDIYQNFKNGNYTTTYIHGNYGGFWNRDAVYSRLKIDNLLFDNVFDENTERINGYISDEELYKKVIEELKGYNDKFFINIIAASSHIPFELEGIENRENKLDFDPGEEYRDILFGNYLEAVNYADYAFGLFLENLKEAGLYEDTVILVYGDHAGLQMYNWEMEDFMKIENPELNDIQTQINYSNVLCGLRVPGLGYMQIDKPVSKLDIKPTLTQICGVEDKFSLGMSMFSDKDFVCLNNGKIITDKYFYDGDWYLIQSGDHLDLSTMPQTEVDKLNFYSDSLQKELDISLSINILNLLK